MFYGDVNNILRRPHFTKHGLHYSRYGKTVLGRTFTQFIRQQMESQYLKEESPAPERGSQGNFVVNADKFLAAVQKSLLNVCTRQPRKTLYTSTIEPFPDSTPTHIWRPFNILSLASIIPDILPWFFG